MSVPKKPPKPDVTFSAPAIQQVTKTGPWIAVSSMKEKDDPLNQYWTICRCCGTCAVGTYKYDDVYKWHTAKGPAVPVTWSDKIIAYGFVDKGEVVEMKEGRGWLRLEDDEQDFLITWELP